MVINKRAKFSRGRGSHTHFGGHMKKRRGAGSRGGRGMAGTGKRGDVKKPSIWKDKKYFGKYGFKKKNIIHKVNPVNLNYLEEKLESLLSKKLIEQQGDTYIIDVKKLGFNKVIGYGKPTKKFKISSPSFSKGAIEKIKAAGGEAVELKKLKKGKSPQSSSDAETKEEKKEEDAEVKQETQAEIQKPEESEK